MIELTALGPIAAISAMVFGPLAGWLAMRRARPPIVWFLFGVVIGPIAIALLLVAPPGACPSCGADVAGWPSACPTCGRPFQPDEAQPTVPVRRARVVHASPASVASDRREPAFVPAGDGAPTGVSVAALIRESLAADATSPVVRPATRHEPAPASVATDVAPIARPRYEPPSRVDPTIGPVERLARARAERAAALARSGGMDRAPGAWIDRQAGSFPTLARSLPPAAPVPSDLQAGRSGGPDGNGRAPDAGIDLHDAVEQPESAGPAAGQADQPRDPAGAGEATTTASAGAGTKTSRRPRGASSGSRPTGAKAKTTTAQAKTATAKAKTATAKTATAKTKTKTDTGKARSSTARTPASSTSRRSKPSTTSAGAATRPASRGSAGRPPATGTKSRASSAAEPDTAGTAAPNRAPRSGTASRRGTGSPSKPAAGRTSRRPVLPPTATEMIGSPTATEVDRPPAAVETDVKWPVGPAGPSTEAQPTDAPSTAPAQPAATELGPGGPDRPATSPMDVVPPPIDVREAPLSDRPEPTDRPVEILGSGVFLGGTVPLTIGARYVIGRVGGGIRVLGPVDTGPDRIVFEGSLEGSDATVVADRILLTGSRDQRGRSRWSLAFKAVVGKTPQELEVALRAPAGPWDDVPPGRLS